MKTSFITGLIIFWTVVIAIMVAGFLSFENQKMNAAFKGNATGSDGLGGISDVNGVPTTNAPGTLNKDDGTVDQTVTAEYMTAAYVEKHNSEQDCWLVINNKIYNVTDYISFHPGGKSKILQFCGHDATIAFTTNGRGMHAHSSDAKSLLSNYYVADLNAVIPGTERTLLVATNDPLPTTIATGTASSTIGASKFVIGDTVITTGALSVRKQPGKSGEKLSPENLAAKGVIRGVSVWADNLWWAYVSYTDGTIGWSSEEYLKKIVGVSPVPVVPPVQTPVPQAAGLTSASVATHNTKSNCWLIINNKVYDVTQYIPFHPGGESKITPYCGKEATTAFNTKGGSGNTHSGTANSLLANYYIGTLGAVPTVPVVPVVPIADTAGPTVSFLNPLQGNTLSGVATINAFASDSSGVSNVNFSVDGGVLKTDSTAPYSAALDTTGYSNGSHTLKLDATDKVGNVASASITVTISNATPPAQVSGLTTASVATHSNANDCYLIINNKVYDVTQYIPFHPGGTGAITPYCGKEATNAFNTKGGQGTHSANAQSILASYYIGTIGSTPVTPVTPTTCSSFSYTSWGSCQSNSSQSRSVTSSSPSGCTGGSPVTSQACMYTPPPPPPSGGLTSAEVATHNSSSNCYLIINNKVYDVTQYIPFHPGGTSRITSRCGTDATTAFNGGGGHNHSTTANNLLANYYVGDLSIGAPSSGAATCSSFTYGSWGSCQSNSTQSRSVTSSSPSGCSGGSPVTTQSCTYTPPASGGTCTAFTYRSWGACQPDGTQTRTVRTSTPTGCTGGDPVTTQSCVYVPPGQTYTVSVDSSGNFDQTSLSLNAGDIISFSYSGSGGEAKVSFSPSTVSGFTLDSEKQSRNVQFTTTGTWTVKVSDKSGNTLTVNVQ